MLDSLSELLAFKYRTKGAKDLRPRKRRRHQLAVGVRVRSSALRRAAYGRRGLTVQFRRGGRIYHYEGVPQRTFTRLIRARRPGRFFSRYIRNRFVTRRVL